MAKLDKSDKALIKETLTGAVLVDQKTLNKNKIKSITFELT